MNMTLRDLTTEYQALMDMLNQENPDLQAVADTLEGLAGEIEEKADNVATMVKEYTYLSEALKNEADNLTQRAKAARSRAEWLVQYLQTSMEALGKTKLETPRNKLTIKKTPAAVRFADENAFLAWATLDHEEYIRQKAPEIDKTAVKNALKDGKELPGVTLEQGQKLYIK